MSSCRKTSARPDISIDMYAEYLAQMESTRGPDMTTQEMIIELEAELAEAKGELDEWQVEVEYAKSQYELYQAWVARFFREILRLEEQIFMLKSEQCKELGEEAEAKCGRMGVLETDGSINPLAVLAAKRDYLLKRQELRKKSMEEAEKARLEGVEVEEIE